MSKDETHMSGSRILDTDDLGICEWATGFAGRALSGITSELEKRAY